MKKVSVTVNRLMRTIAPIEWQNNPCKKYSLFSKKKKTRKHLKQKTPQHLMQVNLNTKSKYELLCYLGGLAMNWYGNSSTLTIDAANLAIRLCPREAYAYYVRGRQYFELNRPDLAVADAWACLELIRTPPRYFLRYAVRCKNTSQQKIFATLRHFALTHFLWL